jgi:hypothetical protein
MAHPKRKVCTTLPSSTSSPRSARLCFADISAGLRRRLPRDADAFERGEQAGSLRRSCGTITSKKWPWHSPGPLRACRAIWDMHQVLDELGKGAGFRGCSPGPEDGGEINLRGSQQQLDAQPRLEAGDHPRYRWLRHPEFARNAREAAGFAGADAGPSIPAAGHSCLWRINEMRGARLLHAHLRRHVPR